ncbi:MAG: menaquinone-dependent protoporphyrinogen IX dehydrogenase [Planctomycetota bacterium]
MRCLIVYSSTEGQTEKIARALAERCRSQGHEAETREVSAAEPDLSSYDRVIVGGSIHINKHQRALTRFVRERRDDLNRHQGTAFFSVSLSASGDEKDRAAARGLMKAFLERQEWRPRWQAIFAGAVRWKKYGFFKRFLIRQIIKRKDPRADLSGDLEYTDWAEVDRFADEVMGD